MSTDHSAAPGRVDFAHAREVADAVLFEGYVLYPYRASSDKNRMRWQFGVLMPECADLGEPSSSRTECLVDPREDAAELDLTVRFLRVRERVDDASADGRAWQEGDVVEIAASVPLEADSTRDTPFFFPEAEVVDEKTRRRSYPLSGFVRVHTKRIEGPYGTLRVRVDVVNTTPAPGQPVNEEQAQGDDDAHREAREVLLRHSLIGAHTLLGVRGGKFLSLLDPPEWARPAAESCENLHTYPVLIGDEADSGAGGISETVMLSSPIILYDNPRIAPESPADLYDATEIDEILTLRTMALTDDEKAEARDTDPRAAAIIDQVDNLPAEMLERLHGAVRYLREVTGETGGNGQAGSEALAAGADASVAGAAPWWDPGVDASVSPETDTLRLADGVASKGARVVLRPSGHPSARGTDAQDMFLAGRQATVAAVFYDVDDSGYLAVTLDDDPAADLHLQHGRYFYFVPGEVELVSPGDGATGGHEPPGGDPDATGGRSL